MSGNKKQDVRLIFKVAAWLAFIMLGWLGIRSYKLSIEKLKTNQCIDEIFNLSNSIREAFSRQNEYDERDYAMVEKLSLFPKGMYREGFREATNAYWGGVDIYYSYGDASKRKNAFEISFQGLSSFACENLIKMDWGDQSGSVVIAVAGYNRPTPSGTLDHIYIGTEQSEIRESNIFLVKYAKNVSSEKIKQVCNCEENICSVVWKFR